MRRVEVKKIMKKNQVIITSLAILIAVAGYLNFADVDLGFKDKETSTDSSSILDDVDYDLTDETALLDENGADGTTQSEVMDTASPGEAVLTGASDFAAQAKVSREQVRSQNKADLQAIISNKDISEEEKQNAINTMVSMTDLTEKEAAAELLLEAKGFENVIVNLTGETADVVVPDADLEDAKRAQIEDIVKRKTGVAAESIVITPLSQSKNASDVINTADEAEKIREVQRIMRKVQVRRCRIPLHLWKAIRRIKHLRTQRRLQISRTIRLLIQREFTTELP